MHSKEVMAKAQLLREEITDIIAFDPQEQADFNDRRVLDKAAGWVFRHQDPVKVLKFISLVTDLTWDQKSLRSAIEEAFNG